MVDIFESCPPNKAFYSVTSELNLVLASVTVSSIFSFSSTHLSLHQLVFLLQFLMASVVFDTGCVVSAVSVNISMSSSQSQDDGQEASSVTGSGLQFS